MYLLEEKIWFWLLLAIPVIILLFLGVLLWQRAAQKRFADSTLFKKSTTARSLFKPVLKTFVLSLSIFFFVIALFNL